MTLEVKIILGAIAVVLTCVAHIPYIVSVYRGKTRPHMFTWIIWELLTAIIMVAQILGGAGAGAWSTIAVMIPSTIITCMSFKYGDKNIARADWVMFITGLAAIPVWVMTSNPLWAVLIAVGIDALAFGPTFRKSWRKPHEENSTMYGVNIIRHSCSIGALSVYSLVTALYPVMLVLMNGSMWVMLMARRRNTLTRSGE